MIDKAIYREIDGEIIKNGTLAETVLMMTTRAAYIQWISCKLCGRLVMMESHKWYR